MYKNALSPGTELSFFDETRAIILNGSLCPVVAS